MTALHDRGQYAELVVERFAERPAVVQMNGKRVVTEQRERLIMMAVHVAHEEVKHGQVHEIQHPAATVVWRHASDDFAVIGIYASATLNDSSSSNKNNNKIVIYIVHVMQLFNLI